MDVSAFVIELVTRCREDFCSDIDGADLQDLFVRHGLMTERPATPEDCEAEWAQEYGVDVGDTILVDTDEFTALRTANNDR